MEYIEENEPVIDEWENQVLCETLKEGEVYVISLLADFKLEDMMFISTPSIERALDKAVNKSDESSRILVSSDEPYCLSYQEGSSCSEKLQK